MRQYLLSGACAATMLLALTPAAQAADVEMVPEPGWSWYVSVFGGWSHAKDEDGSFTTTSSGVYLFDLELDDGFTAGLALGAHINEWLRGEIEVSGNWHDVEGAIGTTPPLTTYYVEGDEDALFVLANLWFEVPLGMGPFRPYAGGGVGFGRLSLDLDTTGGSPVVDDSDWGFAWQLGAGVAFDVSSNMAIDIGYRYKRIHNVELDVETALFSTPEGIDKDYSSHNIIAGIRFSF
jgi:opacity protein-like surface antigen